MGELWNENIYERVRFFEWIGWQYLLDLDSYGMACHLKMDKLYGAHVFELIRCYTIGLRFSEE